MKVSYPEINFVGQPKSDILFLKNNYLWYFFSTCENSRYFGGYLFINDIAWRFLDALNFSQPVKGYQILSSSKAILELYHNQVLIELHPSSLEITFANWDEIKITFDIKKIFDNNPFSRKIDILPLTSNVFLVKELFNNFELNLRIETDAPLKINHSWEQKKMNFDKKRNSPPFDWWIYNGLEGKVRQLRIIIIDQEPIKKVAQNIIYLTNNKLQNFILQRINSLVLNSYLPAGFPWFFENWYRDELLSLYLAKDYLDVNFRKQRLINYLTNLGEIWNKNKLSQPILASDTLLLLIANLDKDLLLSYGLVLEKIFNYWQKEFIKNGEISLPPYSTWMDTKIRNQALEISSLYLKSLRQLAFINKNYISLANDFKNRLYQEINNNSADINLIFAFLFLSDIFSLSQWQKIFTKIIEKNYLWWGGFSTLAKDNPNFQLQDSGENSLAYHSGNSWYYLNNLFSLALKKINHHKFKVQIKEILKSSLEDLLLDGALGFSSEFSEAQARTSQGALVQLWSLVSLLRLFQNIDIILESLSNSHNIITIKT
jgi:hypothetical protein